MIKGGVAAGALSGAGMAEGGIKERAQGAVMGGALGGALGGVIGKGIKIITPKSVVPGQQTTGLGRSALKAVAGYFDNDTIKAGMAGVATKTKLSSDKVQRAVKTLDDLGIFSPSGTPNGPRGLAPSIDEIFDRTQAVAVSKADELKGVLSQIKDDPRTLTSIDDIDLSELQTLRFKLAKNTTDRGSVAAVKEIDDLISNIQGRFSAELAPAGRGAPNVDILDLQEYKQHLQGRTVAVGGFGPETDKALAEAMEAASEKIRTRIENVADAVIDPTQRGIVKTLNRAQEAAAVLLPSMKQKKAAEALKDFKGPGTLSNIIKYGAALAYSPLAAVGVGVMDAAQTNTGALVRAGIPRNVKAIKQWATQMLPSLAQQNPGMAGQIQQMLKLPENKLIPAMQPFLAQFGDEFEASPYVSLMNGKIWNPEERDSHRAHIIDSVEDPIDRAKQLSALNKDGTVLGNLPE